MTPQNCNLASFLVLLLSSTLLYTYNARPVLRTSPESTQVVVELPSVSDVMGFFEGSHYQVSCKNGKAFTGFEVHWGELDPDMSAAEPAILGIRPLCAGKPLLIKTFNGWSERPASFVFGQATNLSHGGECDSKGISAITWRRTKFDNEDDEEDEDAERNKYNRFPAGMILHCAANSTTLVQLAMVLDLSKEDPAKLESHYQYQVGCPNNKGHTFKALDVWSSAARWAGFQVVKCSKGKGSKGSAAKPKKAKITKR